jgi:PD-(D/E)XK nuclease superfamily
VSDWDEFDTTESKVPRDRWGRPMIVRARGGKPVAYTRATTFAGSVEDMFGLGQWQQRMVAIGLSMRKDLLLSVAAHADDKEELNRVVDQAREAAAASAAATTGTALHKLAERYDRGEMAIEQMPESNRDDMQAYAVATAPLSMLGIEQFVVVDDLQVAGTFDRVVSYGGQRYVADIKTGSITYGVGKMSIQLALYSRGLLYDPAGGTRARTDVSQTAGMIIHLPAGQGQCDLYWIDLRAGWEAAQLCDTVRTWRKRKGLLAPASFPASAAVVEVAADAETILEEMLGATEISLEQLIADAADAGALETLWSQHREEWTEEHTWAAAARKKQLQPRLAATAA